MPGVRRSSQAWAGRRQRRTDPWCLGRFEPRLKNDDRAIRLSAGAEEEEGFEPPELALGGFQDRCLRPLGHSSRQTRRQGRIYRDRIWVVKEELGLSGARALDRPRSRPSRAVSPLWRPHVEPVYRARRSPVHLRHPRHPRHPGRQEYIPEHRGAAEHSRARPRWGTDPAGRARHGSGAPRAGPRCSRSTRPSLPDARVRRGLRHDLRAQRTWILAMAREPSCL